MYKKVFYFIFFSILLNAYTLSANTLNHTLNLTQKEKLWLSKNPNIDLIGFGNFEPFLFQNDDGKAIGVLPDYIKEISNTIQHEIKIETMISSGKEGHKLALSSNSYGLSFVINNLKSKNMYYLSKPYTYIPFTIFTTKQNITIIKKKSDLKYKKIAILKGFNIMDKYLSSIKELKIIAVDTPKEQLTLLQNESVDAIVGFNTYHKLIEEYRLSNVKIGYITDKNQSVHFGINKQHPELISILNKAIDKLTLKTYNTINKKWSTQFLNTTPTQNKPLESLSLTKEEIDYLNSKPHLNVMSLARFHPFAFIENDQHLGYSNDLLRLFSEILQKDLKYVTKTWKEQLEMLKEGTLDFIPYLAWNEERATYMDFTDFEYFYYLNGLTINKDSNINSVKDLKGKTIAVVNKYWYHDHLKEHFPEINLLLTKSTEESVRAVAHNKADAAMDNITSMNYYIQESWLHTLKIKNIDELKLPEKSRLYMSVKKGNKLLKSILEKTYNSIPKETIKELKNKWFKGAYVPTPSLLLSVEEKNYLNSKPYISVLSLENFQPFSFRKNGIPMGYSVDTMKLIGKTLNKKIQFNTLPWNEQLEMLKSGELDIIPHLAITDERKKFANYTNFNHITFLIGFAIEKDKQISSMKDLKNKKLAVVKGYYLHKHLEKNFPEIKLLLFKSTEEAVKAVAKGKAFAVVDNIPTLNYFIQDKWLSNLKIANVDDFGLPLETHMPMGVPKDDKHLKSILEKVYTSFSHKKIMQLKQKWTLNQQSDFINTLSEKEKSYLSKLSKIRICVEPNWMPYERITADNQYEGIIADLTKVLSERLNTPFVLQPTKSYAKSQQKLLAGECDVIPAEVATDEMKKKFLTTEVLHRAPRAFATHFERDIVLDFAELKNEKVGVLKNSPAQTLLPKYYPGLKLIPFENTDHAIQKVANKEIDAFVNIIGAISYSIKTQGLYSVKIGGVISKDVSLSMLVNKQKPELVPILNKAINTLTLEERNKINNKWISVKLEKGVDYSLVWKTIITFFVIVIWFLWWNRKIAIEKEKIETLNKQLEGYIEIVDTNVITSSTDLNGNITQVSQAFCDISGYTRDELIGQNHRIINHPDMSNTTYKKLWESITNNITWKGEIKNQKKCGGYYWVDVTITPNYDENGNKIGYTAIRQDITNKKAIEKISITDGLTDIYNRRHFNELFPKYINSAKRHNELVSFLIMDIDFFKQYNDTYGHQMGDEVLVKIAKSLKQSIHRADDYCFRLGGEEFGMIFKIETKDQAIDFTNTIIENIENLKIEHTKSNVSQYVTASMGLITKYANDIDDDKIIYKEADELLYKAKENGRNQTAHN